MNKADIDALVMSWWNNRTVDCISLRDLEELKRLLTEMALIDAVPVEPAKETLC